METSFWQTLAENAPEESSGFKGEDLPADAWVIVDTATAANGNAAPKIESKETKVGTMHLFKVGLIAKGGDAKLNAGLHANRMVFLDLFLLPGEKELEHNPTQAVGGRFTGFLNTLFATGVGDEEKDPKLRSASRWRVTVGELTKIAQTSGLTIEQYQGMMPLYLGGLAVAALKDTSKRLLIKTKLDSYESGGVKRTGIKAGAFEDFTPATTTARKVALFAEQPAARF